MFILTLFDYYQMFFKAIANLYKLNHVLYMHSAKSFLLILNFNGFINLICLIMKIA